ncbi:hypothetical protein C8Q75DRAFT_807391 [Abortiporus biennis]|nr:hypothetical protein C8Q75DRAFT_807391 [Abortiporus biennis]
MVKKSANQPPESLKGGKAAKKPQNEDSKYALWMAEDEHILIDEITKQIGVGRQADSGFCKVSYNACILALTGKETNNVPKTAVMCENHYGTLKKEFKMVKAL